MDAVVQILLNSENLYMKSCVIVLLWNMKSYIKHYFIGKMWFCTNEEELNFPAYSESYHLEKYNIFISLGFLKYFCVTCIFFLVLSLLYFSSINEHDYVKSYTIIII
jgi:hypothetical protein